MSNPTPIWIDIAATDTGVLRMFYADSFGWTMSVNEDLDCGFVSTDGPATVNGC
jgi:predicted enzyme related to lactoylglutathione lyase